MKSVNAALPPFVELVVDDVNGKPLLLCRSPRHVEVRDYRPRSGPRGFDCPLCMALDLAADDAHTPPERAA